MVHCGYVRPLPKEHSPRTLGASDKSQVSKKERRRKPPFLLLATWNPLRHQVLKDDPQPQVVLAFGFLITN